jgi:hypothetical protein
MQDPPTESRRDDKGALMSAHIWQTVALPAQIDALMMSAVLDKAEGVAAYQGETLPGRFAMPDTAAQVVFHSESASRHTPGEVLHFEVWSVSGGMRFHARVQKVEGRRVCLDRPRTVQAVDRRRSPRLEMDAIQPSSISPDAGADSASWTLVDLSVTGLRLRYDPLKNTLRPGQRIGAWLTIPDSPPMAIEIKIMHLRRGEQGPEAGARITVMTARARLQLHRLLEERRQSRQQSGAA